ncbi:MAG TPA: AAA family ATPase [Puia sp.]|jgi:uncharacterized protein involved in exopolysaccharide biosynthesis/Mrp family chromosome partitioning ATPase
MDFTYLFRVLMKKKWIILGAGVLAAVIAFFFTRNQEKKYLSIAQISTGYTMNDDIRLTANSDNIAFNDADIKFNNVLVTATSPAVISLLSYQLILHDLNNPNPFRYLKQKELQSNLYKTIDKKDAAKVYANKLEAMSPLNSYKPAERDLLEYLTLYKYDYTSIINNLSVARLQRTDYIQIEFTSENPELSAYVVNTLFQEFLRYYKTVRSNISHESIDTLQSLLEKKKQELDAKNEQLRSEGMINVGQENSSKFEMIMNLEGALTEEQNKKTNNEFALQKINRRLTDLKGGGKSTTGSGSDATGSNDEILILRRAMSDAYLAYINSGSSDETLRKKYEQLKSDYQAKVANAGPRPGNENGDVDTEESRTTLSEKKSDLEVDIRAGEANIASLEGKINSMKGNLVKDASKNAIVETLLKDAELANKEYLDAKKRFNEASDVASSSVNNFRQILLGQPPIEPESSKRLLIVFIAGFFAFVTAVLVITFQTYMDSSIKTPAIFAKVVGLPILSMINFKPIKAGMLPEMILGTDEDRSMQENKRDNVFRESIRKLRYEVEKSGKKIFLFASTKKGEGKTTLIQVLSYSLSMSNKRVLIIDTNFCNNDLTVQLKADPILEKIHPDKTNSRTLLDQVRSAVKNVGHGTVFAIGSKGGDYTPSEILPRENLLHHLQALTQEYDYIFLEGPPLNDFSDAKELSQYVEGVIAIFSATHIIKQIDKQSMSFFRELNGKFCGAVLNMVDLENVNAI